MTEEGGESNLRDMVVYMSRKGPAVVLRDVRLRGGLKVGWYKTGIIELAGW